MKSCYCHYVNCYGVLEVLILMLFLCRPSASTTSTTKFKFPFGEHFVENLRWPCVLCYHDHRVVVVCDAKGVDVMLLPASYAGHDIWWIYMCPRPSCRGCLCSDHRVVEMPDGDAIRRCGYFLWNVCRYPVRPLRLPERRLTSVPANSGTPYVLFLAKVMPKKIVKFSMTLLKK